jgi:hypothetical protein
LLRMFHRREISWHASPPLVLNDPARPFCVAYHSRNRHRPALPVCGAVRESNRDLWCILWSCFRLWRSSTLRTSPSNRLATSRTDSSLVSRMLLALELLNNSTPPTARRFVLFLTSRSSSTPGYGDIQALNVDCHPATAR